MICLKKKLISSSGKLYLSYKLTVQTFFFFLFSHTFSFSQNQFSFSDFSQNDAKITTGIYGDGFLNSNSLNNNFFHQFNKNGFISNEIKSENSKNLVAENRIGADLNYGIFYSQKIDSSFNYFISISDRAHLNAQFPKDLFDLTFYGNKKFAGDTAILDNTSINYLRFQQIQSGFVATEENGKRFGFAVSYLKGEENFSMEISKAQLFTQEFGESLSLDFQGEISRSDTSDKGIDAFNGAGFSLDLFYEVPFQTKFFNGKFKVEGNDIGFIQWNKNSLSYIADTSIFFAGVVLSDISQLNDSVWKMLSPDSIQQEIESSQVSTKYKMHLPAILKLPWTLETNKVLFSFGINNRFNANYSSLYFLKTAYKFLEKFSAATKISYGGYGKIAFGAELKLSLKKFTLLAGSNNVEGFVLPHYSGGNSAYVSLRKSF